LLVAVRGGRVRSFKTLRSAPPQRQTNIKQTNLFGLLAGDKKNFFPLHRLEKNKQKQKQKI
jgi:hypothetical protein